MVVVIACYQGLTQQTINGSGFHAVTHCQLQGLVQVVVLATLDQQAITSQLTAVEEQQVQKGTGSAGEILGKQAAGVGFGKNACQFTLFKHDHRTHVAFNHQC